LLSGVKGRRGVVGSVTKVERKKTRSPTRFDEEDLRNRNNSS